MVCREGGIAGEIVGGTRGRVSTRNYTQRGENNQSPPRTHAEEGTAARSPSVDFAQQGVHRDNLINGGTVVAVEKAGISTLPGRGRSGYDMRGDEGGRIPPPIQRGGGTDLTSGAVQMINFRDGAKPKLESLCP